MIRDTHNVIPVTLAVLLHIALFTTLFLAIDFRLPHAPAMPLAIKATLVEKGSATVKPPPEKPHEKTPEKVEPPVPDTDAQAIAAEKKRQQDALVEMQRLEDIRKKQAAETARLAAEAKLKKQAEADARQKREQAAQRKRDEEAEKEKQRIAAEKKREEDIKRQREENERLRREAEAKDRQTEIDAEASRIAAVSSGEMQAYQFAIQQRVQRNWVKPASAQPGLDCVVRVHQLAGGIVASANIVSCNGDAAVQRSIEAAVQKASPLPMPSNPNLFDPDLQFNFKPEQ